MQRCTQVTTTASVLFSISELPRLKIQCSTCSTYVTDHLIIVKSMNYPKPEKSHFSMGLHNGLHHTVVKITQINK